MASQIHYPQHNIWVWTSLRVQMMSGTRMNLETVQNGMQACYWARRPVKSAILTEEQDLEMFLVMRIFEGRFLDETGWTVMKMQMKMAMISPWKSHLLIGEWNRLRAEWDMLLGFIYSTKSAGNWTIASQTMLFLLSENDWIQLFLLSENDRIQSLRSCRSKWRN